VTASTVEHYTARIALGTLAYQGAAQLGQKIRFDTYANQWHWVDDLQHLLPSSKPALLKAWFLGLKPIKKRSEISIITAVSALVSMVVLLLLGLNMHFDQPVADGAVVAVVASAAIVDVGPLENSRDIEKPVLTTTTTAPGTLEAKPAVQRKKNPPKPRPKVAPQQPVDRFIAIKDDQSIVLASSKGGTRVVNVGEKLPSGALLLRINHRTHSAQTDHGLLLMN
jgi:hypothetical protein